MRPPGPLGRGMHSPLGAFVALLLGVGGAAALDNGLALKPPLAFSNWNLVGGAVNESFIRQQADLLLSTGLHAAGYDTVIVDDCWSNMERDADGRLQANSSSFPSGMKALGDYLHSKGLRFGLYADAGERTCQAHPGSRGHEATDARTFADWGVDYLKYDNCYASAEDWVVDRYSAMSNALNATGRPIVFAIVGWGVGDPWEGWGSRYGNVWRTAGDITASWPEILRVLDNSIGLARYSRPSAWADLDMLEVGVGYLTFQEQRAHFLLWALFKSPLMLSTDLGALTPDQRSLVGAPEVLAVNQDPLGVAGDLIWKEGPLEVYAAPLQDGSRAAVLLNRHTLATQYPLSAVTVRWEWLGFPPKAQASVRDLHAQKDLGVFSHSFTAKVNVHDAVMLKISLLQDPQPFAAWRPWTARQYAPVPNPGLPRTVAMVAGVVAGAAVGLGMVAFSVWRRWRGSPAAAAAAAAKRWQPMEAAQSHRRRASAGRSGSAELP